MTATTVANTTDFTSFTFIHEALKSLRHSRNRAATRKHLLNLDDHLLRDMGMTRLDVLHGDF